VNEHTDHQENELVGAYVLDALEPVERTSFETHLATCTHCQSEVAELLPVVDVLPLAADVVEPSPELKTRILDAITHDLSQRPTLTAIPGGAPLGPRRRRGFYRSISRYEAITGLAAAVIIAGLGIWNVGLQNQINHQKQSVAYDQDINSAILNGASVSQLPATSTGSAAQAALVQPHNGGTPYLLVGNMPKNPGNKVYELWYVRGKTPHPITVFNYSGNQPAVVPLSVPTTSYAAAAITLEPGPHGSKRPTTRQIVAGKLSA
jgi:anti-sigma-K factor RskA